MGTRNFEYTGCGPFAIFRDRVSKGFSRCQELPDAVFFLILFKETRGGQTQIDSGLRL